MQPGDSLALLNLQADASREALAANMAELRRRASARYVMGQTLTAALPAAGLAAKAVAPAVGRVASRHPGAVALVTAGAALAAFGDREDYAALADRADRTIRQGLALTASAGAGLADRAGAALGLGRGRRAEGAADGAGQPKTHPRLAGVSDDPATYKTHGVASTSGVGIAVALSFAIALTAGLALSARR
jgi:hypothetical protein